MNGDLGVWAYALTEDDADHDISWVTGVAGATVRATRAGNLTVLVSDVDLAEFGEVALRRNLEDLTWLETVARAHHHVIDAASRLFPLLPMRLATVYTSDESMASVLGAHREDLLDALRRVGGRVEWGVKAYAVPEAEQEHAVSVDSAAAESADRGAGLAYLKRRKAQLSAREKSWRSALEGARVVHAHLSALAAATKLHPPQSQQLSGNQRPMMLNAAYLLDADAGTGFALQVAAAAGAHHELELDLTGPWPPYSFTADDGEEGPPLTGQDG